METKNRISGYDFIKLAFVLAVAVFLYVAIRPPAQPEPTAGVTIPAFPPANFEWEYAPSTRVLLNPQGVQLYRLAPDGVTWQPIIPATLSLQLPGEYRLVQNSQRVWQILDAVGATISTWDSQNFRWVMGIIPTATPPRSTPTLQATLTSTLVTSAPTAIPPTPTLTSAVTQTATLTCSADAQSFLTAGQPAQVLINLKMHTAPEMTNNVFDANPAGEVVDVLQGPVCVPHQTGVYLWWEIRNDDGVIGWSVEATLDGSVYFLEPLE
ncbi:MAG TPA: hypothetical protein VIH16_05930 [Bellilinea sp.]